jgi:tetratricopeptide (TPR) repeat protein
VAALEEARRLAPRQNHYRVYLARGLASLGSAESDPTRRDALYARAEDLLRQARNHRPGDADTGLELGRIQARWAALSEEPSVARARIERALDSLRDAVALSPGRVVAWNAQGSALAIAGRREEALASFDRSLTLDPGYATTYLLAARAQAELGRPEAATEVLERGVRLAQPSASLHRALASRYAAANRIDEADRELQESIAVEPGQRDGHIELVGLRLRARDCTGAAGALREMALRLPGDPALQALQERLSNTCPEQSHPRDAAGDR